MQAILNAASLQYKTTSKVLLCYLNECRGGKLLPLGDFEGSSQTRLLAPIEIVGFGFVIDKDQDVVTTDRRGPGIDEYSFMS